MAENGQRNANRDPMILITINLPNIYVNLLDKLSNEKGVSRSELLRQAIGNYIKIDGNFTSTINKIIPNNFLNVKKKKIDEFFNYCIICDKKLNNPQKPYEFKKLNIIDLRFCCECYKKFEGKSIDEFPQFLIDKIRKKIETYKSQINRLKDKEDNKCG